MKESGTEVSGRFVGERAISAQIVRSHDSAESCDRTIWADIARSPTKRPETSVPLSFIAAVPVHTSFGDPDASVKQSRSKRSSIVGALIVPDVLPTARSPGRQGRRL